MNRMESLQLTLKEMKMLKERKLIEKIKDQDILTSNCLSAIRKKAQELKSYEFYLVNYQGSMFIFKYLFK